MTEGMRQFVQLGSLLSSANLFLAVIRFDQPSATSGVHGHQCIRLLRWSQHTTLFSYVLAPLGFPRPDTLPLAPRAFPFVAPPLLPFVRSSPPRLLGPELGRAVCAGVANLVGIREDGCLSQNDVSLVKNVSSPASSFVRVGMVDIPGVSSFCLARLKESGIGAYCILSYKP